MTYCGVIGMAHDLEVVLRAAKHFQGNSDDRVVFLLVGDGACLDELRSGAERAALRNVVFTGNVPKQCVPELLALSDVCLVHLRAAEAFTAVMPSKIFEAAAMAKPIILGVRGFAAEFVERVGCGLCIAPGDEGGLVEAVDRLSGDEALRERLGGAGREHVVAHFDRNRLAREYLELIEQTA